ncbi:uncharacterized protein LOC111339459 isoform X2 [Stylophora pistillata]|nr:uncharacterized protein LOC111339459 isoform X2 [Stylophora pistillata]
MVTTRTQELNITISLSCCDVTKGKLKQYIEDALAAVQDLAVLPGLRDPQLNSAECIIEGHQPNISSTTEHSWRLMSILVLSFFFSTLFGPLLAFYVTQIRDELSLIKKNTIDFLCGFLLLIFGGLLIAMLCREREVVHPFIEAIQLVTIVVGILVFSVAYCKCKGETNNQSVKKKSCVFIICANLAAYHFCWLLVGIMLNPIWGLVVLLLVCLVIGVSTFAFHTFLSSTTSDKCQPFSSCFAGFLAVCCLIVVVIFAGQSYSGRETADESLKEAVMYLISIFFSWLYWKKWVKKSDECGDSASRSDQAILSQNGQASEHQV